VTPVIPSVSQPFGFSLANSGDKLVVASQTVSFSASGLPSGATRFFLLYFLHSSVLNGIKYQY
jgi:hypothetical protein